MDALKDRLLDMRTKRGLTQEKLAELAGVSQVTILNLEKGKSKTSRNLVDIASALGVSAEWLKNGGNIKPKPINYSRDTLKSQTQKDLIDLLEWNFSSGRMDDTDAVALQQLFQAWKNAKDKAATAPQ